MDAWMRGWMDAWIYRGMQQCLDACSSISMHECVNSWVNVGVANGQRAGGGAETKQGMEISLGMGENRGEVE